MPTKGPRPEKPYPEFPLFAHASGKWAKKIKCKTCYFGRWEDPAGALAEYGAFVAKTAQDATPAADAPREPKLTIGEACELFLESKKQMKDSLENLPRTYADYARTCDRVRAFWGDAREVESLAPKDFSAYKKWRAETCNVVTVGNEVTRVKSLLKWLEASQLIATVATGPDFRKPSKKVMRRHRRLNGAKIFSADEVHMLIHEAGTAMRAMIYLAINCGFHNIDCESLPVSLAKVACETGWVEYARSKTEVERRCPLWPETVDALRQAIVLREELAARSDPTDGLSEHQNAFVLASGKPFNMNSVPICKRFQQIRKNAFVHKGGFYWFRHTFATIGGESLDQVAVDSIMGHVDPSMSAVYRHEISDKRLLHVTETVRSWLRQRAL